MNNLLNKIKGDIRNSFPMRMADGRNCYVGKVTNYSYLAIPDENSLVVKNTRLIRSATNFYKINITWLDDKDRISVIITKE